jgi:S-(hydroxymethyl)glutathione dehydrogenase / alcohol dehydrogenase
MKAAVCYEFGKPLIVEDVDIENPKTGEVKVRISAVAICHSDIHLIKGDWGGQTPMIAGHEAAGVIEEVGPGVSRVKPGDPVVVSLLRSCGRCYYCTTGFSSICNANYALNTESRLRTKRGDPIEHGARTAAFAEYAIVAESQVVSLPPSMPLDRAALLACGVITGVGAVVNTAKVKPSSSVVVIGTGGVGLNAIQGAALSGAFPIIAVDLLDEKLKVAETFGATHSVNARETDLPAAIKSLTHDRGADYAFITVGSPSAVKQGFNMIRPGGTTVIVGIPPTSATVELPVVDFIFGGPKTITATFMGSTNLSLDIPNLVNLYQIGKLKLDELITQRYVLEQINEAIETVETGQVLRNVIMFS